MLARNFSGGGDPFAAAAASAVAGQQQQQRWQGDDSALLPPGAGLVPGGWPAAPPGGADRARNFDVHSNAAEVEEKLARIVERMEAMGFSEQRQRVGRGAEVAEARAKEGGGTGACLRLTPGAASRVGLAPAAACGAGLLSICSCWRPPAIATSAGFAG
jgi:hypothetical protein